MDSAAQKNLGGRGGFTRPYGEVNSPLRVRARRGVPLDVASPSLAMPPARAGMPAPQNLRETQRFSR